MHLHSLVLVLTSLHLTTAHIYPHEHTQAVLRSKLRQATTHLERLALLPRDEDWIFDFTTHPYHIFEPGGVINANAESFPATIGNGLTLAVLNLGPCAMLPPHLHPRAANYVVALNGSVETYMIAENHARTVKTTLKGMSMTIFPAGSLHTMRNTGCEAVQLISALNDEDAGTSNLANGLMSLPTDLLGRVFGLDAATLNETAARVPPVGTGANSGDEGCKRRCGLV